MNSRVKAIYWRECVGIEPSRLRASRVTYGCDGSGPRGNVAGSCRRGSSAVAMDGNRLATVAQSLAIAPYVCPEAAAVFRRRCNKCYDVSIVRRYDEIER